MTKLPSLNMVTLLPDANGIKLCAFLLVTLHSVTVPGCLLSGLQLLNVGSKGMSPA